MFDINTLINNAITNAVAEALVPVRQEYANKMGEMAQKIAELEAQLAEARTAAAPVTIDEAKMVEALNSQEWFWEKLTRMAAEIADAKAEEAIDDHCQNYDHDDYDRVACAVDEHEIDNDAIEDKVRELLDNVTVSIQLN